MDDNECNKERCCCTCRHQSHSRDFGYWCSYDPEDNPVYDNVINGRHGSGYCHNEKNEKINV